MNLNKEEIETLIMSLELLELTYAKSPSTEKMLDHLKKLLAAYYG